MTSKRYKLSASLIAAAVLASACSGTNLHDVGDLGGEGGEGNPGNEGGSEGLGLTGAVGGEAPDGVAGTPSAAGKGGTAGNGGTAGSGDSVPLGGSPDTDGGSPPLEGVECATCTVVAEAGDTRAVATTEDLVYWVDYGTFDNLGNHQADGRLVAISQAGGAAVAITESLEGPIGLEISQDYAYVLLDRSSEPSGGTQLARVSLDDGATQAMEAIDSDLGVSYINDRVYDWFHRYFVTHAGVAYWIATSTIKRSAEDSPNASETLYSREGRIAALTGDDTSLYFIDVQEGLWSLPYAGGEPTLLRALEPAEVAPRYEQLTTSGNYLYALDDAEQYLVRMPKSGGKWQRVSRVSGAHLRIDADSYFVDPISRNLNASLVQRSLTNSSVAIVLARSPSWIADGQRWGYWRAWDVAAESVYFAWDGEIYSAPRVD